MKHTRQHWLKLSGWTIPLAYAAAAVVVGMVFPRLEHHLLPGLLSTTSPAAAMSVCSTIASGMIALTGIVFSLTFVMVQFSATAYSPRLVLWVARDPVMSHALGVFSATFLYAITLLAWVDRAGSGKVPLISVWLVVALLLASMGMFIAIIDRIGSLQINRMLIFTGDQGRKAIAELYPPLTSVAPAAGIDCPVVRRCRRKAGCLRRGPARTGDRPGREWPRLVKSKPELFASGPSPNGGLVVNPAARENVRQRKRPNGTATIEEPSQLNR